MTEHLIYSKNLVNGLIEKVYLSIELSVADYNSIEFEEDKKNLIIEITRFSKTEDKKGNIISWGKKSSHNILDFKLEHNEQIYSLACVLSCIVDNGLSKIFKQRRADDGL